jgi:hypothetical protein
VLLVQQALLLLLLLLLLLYLIIYHLLLTLAVSFPYVAAAGGPAWRPCPNCCPLSHCHLCLTLPRCCSRCLSLWWLSGCLLT